MWKETIYRLHNSQTAGHLGIKATIQEFRKRFYYPGFTEHFTSFIKNCLTCLQLNRVPKNHITPKLQPVSSLQSYPGDMLQIDLVGPLKSSQYKYVLSGIDVFTKYLFAVPLTNGYADTVARELVNVFFQHSYIPQTILSDLGTNFTMLTLSYVKVKFNGELERRALIDTGAFANVISHEFYKELINTNINSITEIEKPDLDKVKMANGNIVKIDKAIKVTFKLGKQTFTEDFLVLIVTTPVILGNPFFVKHKVSICPGQSYIKFPDPTLQINEIKPEKQPRRVVKRKKFGVYTQKKQVLQPNQQAVLECNL